ncbi:MAG: PAS domain S-box protein [Betaproteobacteria bacterium]|nr:PAS domain S-box protein [Betaproteobacteria bacterium]
MRTGTRNHDSNRPDPARVSPRRTDADAAARAEVALQASEIRYRQFIELSPSGVFVQCEGRLAFLNPKAVAMFGGSLEADLLGRPVLDFLHPDDREAIRERGRRINHERALGPLIAAKWLRLDGTMFHGESAAVPYTYDGVPGALVMLQDITARVEAEEQRAAALEALQSKDEEIHAIVDNLAECVIAIDSSGVVRSANPALERVLGYRAEEVVGRNVAMLMPEPERSGHDAHLERYLSTGKARVIGSSREVEGLHKDGQRIPLELAVSEYVVRGERVYLGLMRDIRERKRLIAELTEARADAEEASRTKSAFLATMSHEIRTPMNGVIGMVELLAHGNLPERQAELVRTIRDSATALLDIIDDILDFSKGEAGKLQIERAPVDVANLVEGLCSSMLPVAARDDVNLAVFISPGIPAKVLTDEVRLRQVLYNLVGNAIKFSSGRAGMPGRVSVRAEIDTASPMRLVFTVADNGVGMSPDALGRLFTPFVQAEVSTTRRFGGTGLGLAICRRLVDLMKGDIAVNTALGEGATFTVRLPVEVVRGGEENPSRALEGLDCVVLRSRELRADDIRAYLEHAGARVYVADRLEDAVRLAVELGSPVVLRDAGDDRSPPEGTCAAFAGAPKARHLLITRGRRNQARVEQAEVVMLDDGALRRQALLRAVAVAAGRASPEVLDSGAGEGMPKAAACAPTIAQARAEGRLILVAEDDETNRRVIARQLEFLGYAAQIVGSGEEALRKWREGGHALLLTDLHMPDRDGYSLVEAIRREENGRKGMPILALTANALREEANRARSAGMDECLTKPVQLRLLRAALERWLGAEGGLDAQSVSLQENRFPRPSPVVDESVLKGLIGGDAGQAREFLARYLHSTRELAQKLRSGLAAGDPRSVGLIAHRLKSSSRSVGALTLGELCARMDEAGTNGDMQAVLKELPGFETTLEAVEADIARILAR